MIMVLLIVAVALTISVLAGALVGPTRASSRDPAPWQHN